MEQNLAAPPATRLVPFAVRPPQVPRVAWKRWLGIAEPEKARYAIESLLASRQPAVPAPGELSEIVIQFGLSSKTVREICQGLYSRTLEHAVKDSIIEPHEERFLSELRLALGITSRELEQIEQDILYPRFVAEVRTAIADDILSGGDKLRLERVMQQLRIRPETAKQLYEAEGKVRINRAVTEATSDGRLSPDEDAALQDLARNLGASLSIDARTAATMDRMRLLWRIDNGELPSVNVSITLQRDEVCHAAIQAEWFEQRTRTRSVAYSGFSTSIRICKGVRYRMGTFSPIRITSEETVSIDRGVLYLTNKRLIFDGQKKNSTMRLTSLLGFTPFSDGMQVEKSAGRPPILRLSGGDIELFHAMMSAALSNAN